MYFASRVQAGRQLAVNLSPKYRYKNCAVMALNDGGVVVGAQIATQLHCVLTLLMSAEIKLPDELNRLVGSSTIDKKLLRGHNVIVVSDGLPSGFAVDLAYEFLKPIKMEKLVFAVPFASVPAVDRMHVLADDLYCLNVIEDYRETDHYYDQQDVPDHATVLKTIEHIILNWQ